MRAMHDKPTKVLVPHRHGIRVESSACWVGRRVPNGAYEPKAIRGQRIAISVAGEIAQPVKFSGQYRRTATFVVSDQINEPMF